MLLLKVKPTVKAWVLNRRFDTPPQIAEGDGWVTDVGRAWGTVNKWSSYKRIRRLHSLLVCADLERQRGACGKVDLNIPLLVGRIGRRYFLIDGRHRYRKAKRAGVRILPVFLLSAATTRAISKRKLRRSVAQESFKVANAGKAQPVASSTLEDDRVSCTGEHRLEEHRTGGTTPEKSTSKKNTTQQCVTIPPTEAKEELGVPEQETPAFKNAPELFTML